MRSLLCIGGMDSKEQIEVIKRSVYIIYYILYTVLYILYNTNNYGPSFLHPLDVVTVSMSVGKFLSTNILK